MISTMLRFVRENPNLIIGNLFGFVAIVFAFISYQVATPKKVLFLNSCVIVSVILSYAFLGAWSGMILNGVCLLRNLSYFAEKNRLFSRKEWPWILAVIIGGIGALSWQGPLSLLVIIPLMINTVFLSFNDNNKLRLSLLVTSSMIIIYDACYQAYLALLMESVTIVSAVIGLIRYRKTTK